MHLPYIKSVRDVDLKNKRVLTENLILAQMQLMYCQKFSLNMILSQTNIAIEWQ